MKSPPAPPLSPSPTPVPCPRCSQPVLYRYVRPGKRVLLESQKKIGTHLWIELPSGFVARSQVFDEGYQPHGCLDTDLIVHATDKFPENHRENPVTAGDVERKCPKLPEPLRVQVVELVNKRDSEADPFDVRPYNKRGGIVI